MGAAGDECKYLILLTVLTNALDSTMSLDYRSYPSSKSLVS